MSEWITGPDAASRYGMDQRTIAMAAVAGRIRRVRTNPGQYRPRWTYDAADMARWANEYRVRAGMLPVRDSVEILCHRCRKPFMSEDRRSNRHCAPCRAWLRNNDMGEWNDFGDEDD